MMTRTSLGTIFFYTAIALCFTPLFSAPIALAAGILFAVAKLNSPLANQGKVTQYLLQASVVLTGFSMNLSSVIATSVAGFWITIISVAATIGIGLALAYGLKMGKNTALLISCGTAICGGSAIAAVSPIIQARKDEVSFSLAVVFVLNALALILFPYFGQLLHLSQESFGYWAAISIHDTSSVVGAGSAFGAKALEIATTVKLTRALWIIPVSILLFSVGKKDPQAKIQIPWFILMFIVAIVIRYFLPVWGETFSHMSWLGHKGMAVALFLIGSSLSVGEIKQAGLKPFILGISLWIIVSVGSLMLIK